MKRTTILTLMLAGLLVLGGGLWAAGPVADTVAKAESLYAAGSYADAFALLGQAAADNPDPAAKTALSAALSDIGVAEYAIKNYKNAWECLKLALKLKPTNQDATSYYLKIKKEQDTANLRNEAPPRAAGQATAQPAAGQSGAGAGTAPAANAQADAQAKENAAALAAAAAAATAAAEAANKAEQERKAAELQVMLAQLKAAQDSLSAAQNTVQSTKGETELLKEQLKAQSSLVEKMIETQAQSQKNQTAPAAPAQDAKVIQQTLQLLSAMEKRQATAQAQSPQVVVKTDPAVDQMLRDLNDKINAANRPKDEFPWMYLILGIILLMLAGVIGVIAAAMLRARRRVPRDAGPKETMVYPPASGLRAPGMIAPPERSVPLLEFVGGSAGTAVANRQDLDLRSSLIKADRLQKMYDDVRNGTLTWDTVRQYIDELDVALKSEILKLVEHKLNTGDLVSNEAVLPVIFPFLNDYDDFLRHKAEKLAKTVLLEKTDAQGGDGSMDPFSVQELMGVPKQLAKVLKGRDRSLITANLSRAIAKNLGLSVDECQNIYKGAIAHDAGYLVLDHDELSRLLGKSEITDDEFAVIQSHAVKGVQYFGDAAVPDYLRDAITLHHERKDGSGYPNGLSGADIPLIAQIIGVAETFASLISDRNHRDKVEVSHALAILKDGARSKFERPVVDALVKVVSQNGGF